MTTQTTEHRIACLLRRLLLLLLKQEKQSPLSQQCSSAALSPPSTVKTLTLHLVSPSPFVLVPCCCCCHLLVKSKKSKILLLLLCLKTKPKPKKHHPTFFSSFFLQVPKPAILQNQSKPSCPRHSLCTKPSPAKPSLAKPSTPKPSPAKPHPPPPLPLQNHPTAPPPPSITRARAEFRTFVCGPVPLGRWTTLAEPQRRGAPQKAPRSPSIRAPFPFKTDGRRSRPSVTSLFHSQNHLKGL